MIALTVRRTAATAVKVETAAKVAQRIDLMISYHFCTFCVVIASPARRTAATVGNVENMAWVVTAAKEERAAKVETARRRFTYHIVN